MIVGEKRAVVIVKCRVGESVWTLDRCTVEVHGVRAPFNAIYGQQSVRVFKVSQKDKREATQNKE